MELTLPQTTSRRGSSFGMVTVLRSVIFIRSGSSAAKPAQPAIRRGLPFRNRARPVDARSSRLLASKTRMPSCSGTASPSFRVGKLWAGTSVCSPMSSVTLAWRTGSKGSMPKGLSVTGTPLI